MDASTFASTVSSRGVIFLQAVAEVRPPQRGHRQRPPLPGWEIHEIWRIFGPWGWKKIHSWSFLGRHLIWGNMITQGGTSGIILDFQGLLGWVSNQLGNGIKQIHHKLIGVNKLEEIRVDLLWLLNWTRSESVATQIPFTNFYTANNMLTPTFQMFS